MRSDAFVNVPNELLLWEISGEWHEVDHTEASIRPPGTGYMKSAHSVELLLGI